MFVLPLKYISGYIGLLLCMEIGITMLYIAKLISYDVNGLPGVCVSYLPITPASNLGYLAPPPGQFFMGAKLFIGTPWMGNKGVLKKILVWAM